MVNDIAITPQQAEREYQHYRRATTRHAANCDECDKLAWYGLLCDEATKLWEQRRKALKATFDHH